MEKIFSNDFSDFGTNGNFGDALETLKSGLKVARKGWNGKGMYLFYVDNWSIKPNVTNLCTSNTLPFIAMKTADNKFVPWLASQTDMLAEDWEIVK